MTHATSISTFPTCDCPADQRSIWNIIWSSIATIFLCSWASIHPDIPAPGEKWWSGTLQRVRYMFWTIVTPELVIMWAARQWLGARQIAEIYESKGWTKTHGHFLQMGGFMLFDESQCLGTLSYKRFGKLITEGKIAFPDVTEDEIEDRSKSDGLSKLLIMGQTGWFVLQVIARKVQGLSSTQLEIATLAFAVLNAVVYFFWWNKPFDVRQPIHLHMLPNGKFEKGSFVSESKITGKNGASLSTSLSLLPADPIEDILEGAKIDKEQRPEGRLHVTTSIRTSESPIVEVQNNLEDILQDGDCSEDPPESKNDIQTVHSSSSSVPPGGSSDKSVKPARVNPFKMLYSWIIGSIEGMSEHTEGIEKFEDGEGDLLFLCVPAFYAIAHEVEDIASMMIFACFIGAIFGAVHCAGWFLAFPSLAERQLWRIACLVIIAVPTVAFLTQWGATVEEKQIKGSTKASLLAIVSFILSALFMLGIPSYILARLVLLVEAFTSLRDLPPLAYAVVKWTSFIPHI